MEHLNKQHNKQYNSDNDTRAEINEPNESSKTNSNNGAECTVGGGIGVGMDMWDECRDHCCHCNLFVLVSVVLLYIVVIGCAIALLDLVCVLHGLVLCVMSLRSMVVLLLILTLMLNVSVGVLVLM